jgi:dihydrofolate synthase/folylpolyglutamate synthase
MAGAHQRRNAAAAIAAVAPLGIAVDAIAHATHAGRFERVGDVILDGAHNPHGARCLAEVLREQGVRPVLVIAVSADKDACAIAAALFQHARAVVATRYQQDRALPPAALAAQFPGAHIAPNLASALDVARGLGGPILVAGSLFLVGEARVLLLGERPDPIPVSDPAVVKH